MALLFPLAPSHAASLQEATVLYASHFTNATGCPCSLPYGSLEVINSVNVSAPTTWTVQPDAGLVCESAVSDGSAGQPQQVPKLGTFAYIDMPEAFVNWTDYGASVMVQTGANSTVGLMVRVSDGSDYYRLAWSDGQYLRFERARPGNQFQVLADSGSLSSSMLSFPTDGSAFELAVTCVDAQFDVSVNGQQPWPLIQDNSTDALYTGSAAVYAFDNAGVAFSNWSVYGVAGVQPSPSLPPSLQTPLAQPLAPAVQLPPNISARLFNYTLRYPQLDLTTYTAPLDDALRNAINNALGFTDTWLVQTRLGSVLASYVSALPLDDTVVSAATNVSAALTALVCNASFAFDLGVVVDCSNGSIPVAAWSLDAAPAAGSSSSHAVIIGVVVAVVVAGLAGALLIGYWTWRRLRHRRTTQPHRKHHLKVVDIESADAVAERVRATIGAERYDRLSRAGVLDAVLASAAAANLAGTTDTVPAWSLRDRTRDHLLTALLESAKPKYGHWEVLVVDERTLRITSAACRLSDLIARGVTLVQSLEELATAGHTALRLNTIFFMSPGEASFALLAKAFVNMSPRSAGAHVIGSKRLPETHVFTASRVSDATLTSLREQPQLFQSISTFQELNVDFLALSERVFSLDRPHALLTLYGRRAPLSVAGGASRSHSRLSPLLLECREIGRQLATVFGVLRALRPSIEIHTTSVANDATMEIAQAVKGALECLQQDLQVGAHSPLAARAAKLLIVDRAADPMTPLQHDETYESFVHDVLRWPGTDSTPRKPHKEPRQQRCAETVDAPPDDGDAVANTTRIPDVDDPTWNALRHLHIHDAMVRIHEELELFLTSNAAARMHQRVSSRVHAADGDIEAAAPDGNSALGASIRDLAEAARAAPEYRETVERLSFHLELLEKCAALYESRSLAAVIQAERALISGRHARTGKREKSHEQRRRLENLLHDPTVDGLSKLRLILLWIATRGTDTDTLVRWLSEAEIDEDGRTAVRAFIECFQADRHSAESARRQRRNRNGAPLLRDIIERACDLDGSNDELTRSRSHDDADEEPGGPAAPRTPLSLRRRLRSPIPLLRRGRQNESVSCVPSGTSGEPTLVVIFVVGGVSHAEARLAYEISAAAAAAPNTQVLIGSTRLISAAEYIAEMSAIFRDA
ncbi:hypothetical protein CDCA_CDCA09G2611 [Cyanidium caldarium]|uniref:Uncharacterized protein n=1 Tax=Cyanidium caldarium TaxID=2771 RepID=A0AAV9IWQ6_CYACA|nr:hypothetical protein CDCA_CDCA09G2611 [Cyanidium caldarium]